MSAMRSGRALAALGPLGAATGALLGYGLGVGLVLGVEFVFDDMFSRGCLIGLGLAYVVGAILTWLAHGLSRQRSRPYHAGKAAAVLGLMTGPPCVFAGFVVAAGAGC